MKFDKDIILKITSLPPPTIIAVSGFGGSGKSTFAQLLGSALNVPVVGLDSFIKDKTLTDYSLWDIMDFDRLEREVLMPFNEGKNPVRYSHFDWEKNAIGETREVSHDGRIIVEGVGLLRPHLSKYFGYKIWVDCPLGEAIVRGKKRDREEYHNPQDEAWEGIWKKNDLEYSNAFNPKGAADVIIDNA